MRVWIDDSFMNPAVTRCADATLVVALSIATGLLYLPCDAPGETTSASVTNGTLSLLVVALVTLIGFVIARNGRGLRLHDPARAAELITVWSLSWLLFISLQIAVSVPLWMTTSDSPPPAPVCRIGLFAFQQCASLLVYVRGAVVMATHCRTAHQIHRLHLSLRPSDDVAPPQPASVAPPSLSHLREPAVELAPLPGGVVMV
jgi:hypothetical protein